MEAKAAVLADLLLDTRDGDWGDEVSTPGHMPYRVIRGTDFSAARYGNLSNVPIRYISESSRNRRTLQKNDIIIETAGGSRESPTGRTLLVTERLLASSDLPLTCASFCRFLRANPALVEPRFLYWYLQHLYVIGEMWVHQVQHTGVARFQYTRFASSVPIPLPPLPEQQAIAHILGTLDDKIELNRRMNETLEAIARALFTSWFVDFDPVRARAEDRQPAGMDEDTAALFPNRFEVSELGEIPMGWQVGRLDDLLVLQRGYDLPADQRTPGPYPVISASGPSGIHSEYKALGPGVTTGRSGLLGKVFLVHENFWPLNTSLYIKEYRISRPAHAYHLLNTLDFAVFNSGSAVPTLNRNHVHNLPVVVPPQLVVEAFETRALPLLRCCFQNDQQSQTLAAIRDTLLPKLLSGEIRVKEAEKLVEAKI